MACCCGEARCNCNSTCCLGARSQVLCGVRCGNPVVGGGECYLNYSYAGIPDTSWAGVEVSLKLVYPTCTTVDGNPVWSIEQDYTLRVSEVYETAYLQRDQAIKNYKVRPTIEMENGCPKITVGDWEFVSSVNVDNWDDTIFLYGFVFKKEPVRPPRADVLAHLEPPAGLASSIFFECTPSNPLP